MDFVELKKTIGESAQAIIARELNLSQDRTGKYVCFMTSHQKGAVPITWLDNSFHCNDCSKSFDILNLADSKTESPKEKFDYLKSLAGVQDFVPQRPQKKQEPIFGKDFFDLPEIAKKGTKDNPKAVEYLKSRCLDHSQFYGVSGDDNAIYLNYFSKRGTNFKLHKIKGRRIGDIENGQNKYLGIGGGSEIMFGANLYKGQKTIIITEGEFDAMALYEGILFSKSTQHLISCSVPSGTSLKWIRQCKPFLDQFETIVICPDNDEAGIKFREGCFQELDDRRVKWIDISRFDVNDVNELLIKKGKKAVADLLNNIEFPYHSQGMSGKDIEPEANANYIKTGFFGLDRCLQGLKMGELTLLAGESNDGKTTIARQILNHNLKAGVDAGVLFGEETPYTFMNECIRQSFISGSQNFEKLGNNEWGDQIYQPTSVAMNAWKQNYGSRVNLFQINRVRSSDKIGDRILDWISHCADVEKKKLIIIDNLMKVTADEAGDEYAAQARFIESLYRLAQKKMVHIILIVHTKKIVGLIDANSISGTKKLYNTPDNVFFFQRLDRFTQGDGITREAATKQIRKKAGDIVMDFSAFIWAHKIRRRNSSYTRAIHAMCYDPRTTLSQEILPDTDFDISVMDYGSSILSETDASQMRNETAEPFEKQIATQRGS